MRIWQNHFFTRSLNFSDDGCLAAMAETLCNLAHVMQSLTAGPTKKGFIFT